MEQSMLLDGLFRASVSKLKITEALTVEITCNFFKKMLDF